MRHLASIALVALALSGCTEVNQAVDNSSRTLAKRVVDEVAARQFPGLEVKPFTDCIIDEASSGEITRLAGDAITGVDAQTIDLVVGIATRPDTALCIAKAGLAG